MVILNKMNTDSLKRFLDNKILSFKDIKTTFKNIKSIEKIGKESKNGFIHQISDGKRIFIIKSVQTKDSDNISYEYYVGKCINSFKKRFPFFCNTYALCKYSSPEQYNIFKHIKSFTDYKNNEINLEKDIIEIDFDIHKPNAFDLPCNRNKYICLIIEYLPVECSLRDLKIKNNNNIFEKINILFIIYSMLNRLSKVFTHYDLHRDNVVLLKVPKNNYITIKYYINSEKYIEVKTKYIPVIIDYGRCYCYSYEYDSNQYSKMIPCPDNNSFQWFVRNNKEHIRPFKSNITHDLRLIRKEIMKIDTNSSKTSSKSISHKNKKNNEFNYIKYYNDNIKYINSYYQYSFGNKEMHNNLENYSTDDLLSEDKSKFVYNVNDVYLFLLNIINHNQFIIDNEKYLSKKKSIHDLDIYLYSDCKEYEYK
jgi:hypothetical protein